MVVKKRSGIIDTSERFILPLVHEPEEKELMMTLSKTEPLHQRYEDGGGVSFWRRWSSSQLSQVEDCKKHDTPALPSWCNPQDDYVSSIPPRNQIILTTRRKKADLWSLITFCLVVIGGMAFWHLKTQLRLILSETETAMALRSQINIKLRSAEKDVRMLSREVTTSESVFKKEREELRAKHAQEHENAIQVRDGAQAALDSMKGDVDSFNEQNTALKTAVQSYSRRQVEDTYGKNKRIQVEFTLDFADGSEGPTNFKVEMASLDLVPHSVHLFLQMISLGLWNGCSFVMKAAHVLKAAPLPYKDSAHPAIVARSFVNNRVNGPIFQEYNSAFPHKTMTLGFVGNDNPSFYINTEDNSDVHAGQSAFARVVSGFETLRRVDELPNENGVWLRDRVGIKGTRIIVV